jgi:glycosyltransferase involved in cell wall biosynthesis
MPFIFESFDLSAYDIVISVTSAEAKGILTAPHQLHICYLLTPPRYLYQHKQHSLDSHWLLRLPIFRQAAQLMLGYLEWWDQIAVFRPDTVIPISRRVAKRVREFYPAVQPTAPLYPPVDLHARPGIPSVSAVTKHAHIQMVLEQEYFLIISRLVSYKRIELAVQACAKAGKNLVVVGSGPYKKTLISLAQKIRSKSKILFLESVSPSQLVRLYTRCQAVIMPGEEDFGIVALEANRYGKAVLLNAKSGAAELIQDKVHGIHIKEESVHGVSMALQQWEKTSFSASKIRQNPVKYGTEAFVKQFSSRVERLWQQTRKEHV